MREEPKKKGRKPLPPEERRVGLTIKLHPTVKEDLVRASYWLRLDITEIVEPLILSRLAELRAECGARIFQPIPPR